MLMNPLDDKLKNGFLIHDCTVFPSRNIVESPAGEQHLEPKAMLVLLALTAKAGDVVSREQLLESINRQIEATGEFWSLRARCQQVCPPDRWE